MAYITTNLLVTRPPQTQGSAVWDLGGTGISLVFALMFVPKWYENGAKSWIEGYSYE